MKDVGYVWLLEQKVNNELYEAVPCCMHTPSDVINVEGMHKLFHAVCAPPRLCVEGMHKLLHAVCAPPRLCGGDAHMALPTHIKCVNVVICWHGNEQ